MLGLGVTYDWTIVGLAMNAADEKKETWEK